MPLFDALEGFLTGFSEVRRALLMAGAASPRIEPREFLAPQQILTRSAVVLLCSHVAEFFERLPTEYVIGFPEASPWANHPVGVKSVIAVHVKEELARVMFEVDTCTDPHRLDKFKTRIDQVQTWLNDIGRFRSEVPQPWLRGFYKEGGPKAVEQLLTRLRPNGPKFFDWLAARNHDRSKFWVTLDGLVKARNAVAHGDAAISFSVNDIRSYAAVSVITAREACRYLS
jgi:hypothetical protein